MEEKERCQQVLLCTLVRVSLLCSSNGRLVRRLCLAGQARATGTQRTNRQRVPHPPNPSSLYYGVLRTRIILTALVDSPR